MLDYEATELEERAGCALNHDLRQHFPALAQFSSTKELEASMLYARLRPEIERVLNGVAQESFADSSVSLSENSEKIRATAWNIERGIKLDGIIRMLGEHVAFRESDVLLLTELDYGMARSGNRFVAREIAEELKLNYVFAPCYINLEKGSGLEAHVAGENQQAIHGNALFSRYPLCNAHSIRLPNGKDKMRGREKRLGSQRAVVADMMHPLGEVRLVSLHLDAHSTQRHRHRQMKIVLDHLGTLKPDMPVLIGGDWNTSTYNSRRALYSIAGFARRVAMGVRRVIVKHYLHPDRWFERKLFREIEKRGYDYRGLNETGAGTLHYSVEDLSVNTNMRDWIPNWCFWFINWALKENGGRCSLKLDWFAGKGLRAISAEAPRVIGNMRDDDGPLSDHDAIMLDFVPE